VDAGFAKHQITQLTREWYRHPNGPNVPMKRRSMVGVFPLFAVEVLDPG
jgi:hypothetical protein